MQLFYAWSMKWVETKRGLAMKKETKIMTLRKYITEIQKEATTSTKKRKMGAAKKAKKKQKSSKNSR